MSASIERVRNAAERAGLPIEIRRMGASTRTAEEAAAQCGCAVSQIVKSLVFEGKDSGRLYLFLIGGDRRLDADKARMASGETLERADPRKVRDETGFAIGGVAPIGHAMEIATFADRNLLALQTVWAAAGAHDAVFEAQPAQLVQAAKASVADLV
jgi:prolyl-tRNA editing enzyme YbaK/EbsC (Cys-tRNA(Pro) deacylase)